MTSTKAGLCSALLSLIWSLIVVALWLFWGGMTWALRSPNSRSTWKKTLRVAARDIRRNVVAVVVAVAGAMQLLGRRLGEVAGAADERLANRRPRTKKATRSVPNAPEPSEPTKD